MGIFRYLLALSVLMAHVGGLGWISPRVAVYSFYCVSGYLIFRVLDGVYMDHSHGVAKFYLNRFLRLAPLFLVMLFLAYLVSYARDGHPHDIGNNETVSYVSTVTYTDTGKSMLHDLKVFFSPEVFFKGGVPYFGFDRHNALHQGWSIGIEMTFYVIAPLLLLFYRKNVKIIYLAAFAALLAFIYFGLESPDFENFNYKNFITSFYAFLGGVLIYHFSKQTSFRFSYRHTIPFLLIWFYALWFWSTTHHSHMREMTNMTAVFVLLFFTLPVVAVVCFTRVPECFESIDRWFGNMSYGIYLNHFLVASLMLTADEIFARHFNYERIFGIPNRTHFGVQAIVFSTLFAHFTYLMVEEPVERLRKKLRA